MAALQRYDAVLTVTRYVCQKQTCMEKDDIMLNDIWFKNRGDQQQLDTETKQ